MPCQNIGICNHNPYAVDIGIDSLVLIIYMETFIKTYHAYLRLSHIDREQGIMLFYATC